VSGDRLDAEIQILDVLGRLVRRMSATELPSGVNHIEWDGTDQRAAKASNGIYFVRVRHADKVVASTRIVIAR
jgi:flagellar hook assembly protein FlgD